MFAFATKRLLQHFWSTRCVVRCSPEIDRMTEPYFRLIYSLFHTCWLPLLLQLSPPPNLPSFLSSTPYLLERRATPVSATLFFPSNFAITFIEGKSYLLMLTKNSEDTLINFFIQRRLSRQFSQPMDRSKAEGRQVWGFSIDLCRVDILIIKTLIARPKILNIARMNIQHAPRWKLLFLQCFKISMTQYCFIHDITQRPFHLF